MFAKSFSRAAVVFSVMTATASLHAGIVITGTRVVYPSDQKTVAVQVKNEGIYPALMQAWIDDGNADLTPDEINVPFVLMPPISRVDASTGQSINISHIHADLPQDRESIYWLNILDIPSKPQDQLDKEAGAAVLQIAVRSRIKMFYRPASLKDEAIKAPEKLQWSFVGSALNVKNPTPYYVNISSLEIDSSLGKTKEIMSDGLMLAPFSDGKVDVEGLKFKTFKVLSINDYGGIDPIGVDLNH